MPYLAFHLFCKVFRFNAHLLPLRGLVHLHVPTFQRSQSSYCGFRCINLWFFADGHLTPTVARESLTLSLISGSGSGVRGTSIKSVSCTIFESYKQGFRGARVVRRDDMRKLLHQLALCTG